MNINIISDSICLIVVSERYLYYYLTSARVYICTLDFCSVLQALYAM